MRRQVAIAAVGVTGLLLVVLTFTSVQRLRHRQEVAARTAVLPPFEFQSLDGRRFTSANLDPAIPVTLVHFSTQCEFCAGELGEITGAGDLFRGVRILLISSQSPQLLQRFAETNDLRKWPNISVVHDPDRSFDRIFGASAIPRTLVYDAQHRLVKDYTGEIRHEALLPPRR